MVDGSRALAFFRQLSLAHRVGLSMIAAGVLIQVFSLILGELIFLMLSELVELFGVPEQRDFLPRSEPEAGSDILSLLGFAAIICGGAIVGIRSLIEALSSDGNPRMIQGLGRSGRVGLGTVAMGLLMAIFGSVGESILREVSSSHYGSELSTSILSAVARIGGVLLLCGFLILVLGQTGRRSMLLGWVDRKGWGKIGCGWVNKLGLAFVAIGFLTSVAGLEETLAILTVAGGAIILVGLIFHLTEAGTP